MLGYMSGQIPWFQIKKTQAGGGLDFPNSLFNEMCGGKLEVPVVSTV